MSNLEEYSEDDSASAAVLHALLSIDRVPATSKDIRQRVFFQTGIRYSADIIRRRIKKLHAQGRILMDRGYGTYTYFRTPTTQQESVARRNDMILVWGSDSRRYKDRIENA